MTNFRKALTASPEEASEAYGGVTERIADTLGRLGIPTGAPSPTCEGVPYSGSLPEDLDSLSYAALSNLMRANVEWNRYLHEHRTAISNEVIIAKEQLKAVRAAIIQQRGKDSLECDLRYINHNVARAELECLCAVLDTALQGAKDTYKLLSRVVTVRGQDQERVTRNENFSRGYTGNRP
jgi:hypothetical protein